MGAAGSIVVRNSDNDAPKNESDPNNPHNPNSTTIPTQDPVPPAKAPAKEKEDGRSKFPSLIITKQAEPKQKKTEKPEKAVENISGQSIFKIELLVNNPSLQFLKVPSVLLLRVSIESLDLIREGEGKSVMPLFQVDQPWPAVVHG